MPNNYLLKIEGSDIVIASANDVNRPTIISSPVIQKFESSDENIPLISSEVLSSNVFAGWYIGGTVINRIYENDDIIITLNIIIQQDYVTINSTANYKQAVDVNYVGFPFAGDMIAERDRTVFASGTGQAIIGINGMFFHDGRQTPHVVLSDLNTNFLYKQYQTNDSDDISLMFLAENGISPARILLQPDGYDSSLTISNHADLASVARQRAVHFGTSDITSPDYGTKGLTGLGIKSDWSVWAGNDALNTPGFATNTEYKALLDSIKAAGSEIIPHNVQSGNSNRDDAISLLPEYDCTNWMDHGLSGGSNNIGIASRGWDTENANYFIDLLQASGIDKAWSYEDTSRDRITDRIWGFPNNIAYYNDHLATPNGENILLWKGTNRPFRDKWLDLDVLIDNCGSIDAHDYIAASDRQSSVDVLTFDYTHYPSGDGYAITSGFNNILAQIADKKAEGKIWNPSVTQFLEYFKRLKNVRLEIVSPSQYKLTNSGDLISGFSMLICKENIIPTIGGVTMNYKSAQRGTICWADLPTGVTYINI